MIHKDISPANLVCNRQTGQLKIIDFGIASRLPRLSAPLKNPEFLEGTLAYIAPEQTGRLNRSLDYRADLYALGASFYEMLAGRPPFVADSPGELVYCHLARQPQPLDERFCANAARAFQEAIVEVLVKKSLKAMKQTGLKQLVVAGGVGANKQLRATLDDEARRKRFRVYYPELEFCTDNGAMIALAGCLRLQAGTPAKPAGAFAVQPRWPLMEMVEKA